jgi:hypothetical protein
MRSSGSEPEGSTLPIFSRICVNGCPITHALNPLVQLDGEPAAAEDRAILKMFQVLAINLCCFFALTDAAMFFGVTW